MTPARDKSEQAILDYLEKTRAGLEEFLLELVRAESVNPPGDTRRAAQVVEGVLGEFAERIDRVVPREESPSLVAWLNPGARPQLVFNSHMDTVPVGSLENWSTNPFGEIRNGILYGRGAADAKGCLAAMIWAGKALAESGVSLGGSLALNPVSDEESGGLEGTRKVLEAGLLEPDACVVGEITTNQVAIAHKGVVWMKLTTHGKTAHASTPWEGVNAISHMVRILHLLETELVPELALRKHPLTPPPSLNLGIIQGGIRTNVVADHCEVTIDRRILPGETVQDAVEEIRRLIDKAKAEAPTIDARLEVLLVGTPLETSPDEEIVRLSCQACKDMGLPSEPVGYQQASDGRFFRERGIPTVLIGPGIPELAHTPDEHIALADVYRAAQLYALIAYRMLRSR